MISFHSIDQSLRKLWATSDHAACRQPPAHAHLPAGAVMLVAAVGGDRMLARCASAPGDERPQQHAHDRDHDQAADELGERELPSIRIQMTAPSSITRFVELNWKASADAALEPFWNRLLAIATAA